MATRRQHLDQKSLASAIPQHARHHHIPAGVSFMEGMARDMQSDEIAHLLPVPQLCKGQKG